MTSPYITREARKLRIVVRNPARAKTIISAHADHRPSDYRFSRVQTDPAPLEKSPPLQSAGARLLRGAFIAAVFAALWAASSGAVWLMTRN
jgi:hypothetical protein